MPELERILQNTPGTLSQQWYEDGAAVDPGTVTLGITRADGTTLLAAGTGTSGTGSNPRTYSLNTTQTALLDRFTVTWTSTSKGTLVSYVEVVGGFLFSLSELSAEVTGSTATYTAAEKAAARLYAETQLEQACGVAFVPRYELETLSGSGTSTLVLKWPRVRAVRSVVWTYNGVETALTSGDLSLLMRSSSGFVSGYSWTAGYDWRIGYEHGHDFPSPGASEAALVLAKHKLIRGPIDERATQRPSEFGPVNLATPGMFGSLFGIRVVDAFVTANNMNVGVA